jgi:hypothetical protein
VASWRGAALWWLAGAWAFGGVTMIVSDWIVNQEDVGFHAVLNVIMAALACGVPKLRSHRGIIPICRQNRVLTPHTDDAEKLRG